ncbi:MAG TPA: tRNA (adenosine(37)-N6)-threonylcarbamoyltransferase complex transferase subunit TsaD [Chitinophagaceae bacterium]|nr:tRNA (adenosine(37)-N6)-threonylcarbamoyltransferase complex transferase subunit TsaD [Chitinophagaceae bacterium]
MSTITLLAIESSCDETSASVLRDGKVLSNITYTQTIHEKYGGVVPEEASRLHIRHIVPVVQEALLQSGIQKEELHAIAFTQSPGLIGALMVGASFAKAMAQSLAIPCIAVHHMQAHVLANLIADPNPPFPFLCLTVSGGHTQIVRCDAPLQLTVLGETLDDAAGEAFDKSAKLLGLPYPGGPLIDRYAREGNPKAFVFARPQIEGLNFSFSGVKTSILYFLNEQVRLDPDFIDKNRNDLCASIQYTIIQILIRKLVKASRESGIRHIAIAGGVSANSGLREAIAETARKEKWNFYIPDFQYCTDNAAMIAITAYYKYLAGEWASLDCTPSARGVF